MIFLLKKHNLEILNFILIWLVSFDATWYFWPGRLKWVHQFKCPQDLAYNAWTNLMSWFLRKHNNFGRFVQTVLHLKWEMLNKILYRYKGLLMHFSICFSKTEPFTYSDCYHITSYVPRFMNTSLQNCHVQCRMEGTLHMTIGVLSI